VEGIGRGLSEVVCQHFIRGNEENNEKTRLGSVDFLVFRTHDISNFRQNF
jgi:hypothetical protein